MSDIDDTISNISLAGTVNTSNTNESDLLAELGIVSGSMKVSRTTQDGVPVNKRTVTIGTPKPKPAPEPTKLITPPYGMEPTPAKVEEPTPEPTHQPEPEPSVTATVEPFERLREVENLTLHPKDREPVTASSDRSESDQTIVQSEANPAKQPEFANPVGTTPDGMEESLDLVLDVVIGANQYSALAAQIGFAVQQAKDDIAQISRGPYTLSITLRKRENEETI